MFDGYIYIYNTICICIYIYIYTCSVDCFPTYKLPFIGDVHLPFCGEMPRFQATVVSYNSAISASVASSVVDDMGFFCGERLCMVMCMARSVALENLYK